MGNILKNILKFILFFGIGIFFVWLSVRKLPTDGMNILGTVLMEHSQNFMFWMFLFLAFVAGGVSNYIRALRNRQLLEPLGYVIRKNMAFYSVMVCYIANYAFPRLGEVLRCTFLQRYEKVPFDKSLGTVVAERAVDFVIMLIILAVAIFLNLSVVGALKIDGQSLVDILSGKTDAMFHSYRLYVCGGIIILLLLLIFFTKKWWQKMKFFTKISNFFLGIGKGLISVKDVKQPGLFIFYSLFIWVLWILETVFCFHAFHFLSDMTFMQMFCVFAIGNIGFLIGPGGIGTYPLIVAEMLVLYGIDYTYGFGAGWIGWGVQTAQVFILGIFSLVAVSFVKRKE